MPVCSVIFVNENENENGEKRENNEFVNEDWNENEKMMITKTKKLRTKTKMPKQQNLSLKQSASIQYGAYGCYGRTALNPWLTVDGI